MTWSIITEDVSQMITCMFVCHNYNPALPLLVKVTRRVHVTSERRTA